MPRRMVNQMRLPTQAAAPTPSLSPSVQRGSLPGAPKALRCPRKCAIAVLTESFDVAVSLRSQVNQGQSAFRIEFPFQLFSGLLQHHFQRRTYMRFEKMSAHCGTVSLADDDMRMHLRLALIQRDVAD